jgi:hypothetical protein
LSLAQSIHFIYPYYHQPHSSYLLYPHKHLSSICVHSLQFHIVTLKIFTYFTTWSHPRFCCTSVYTLSLMSLLCLLQRPQKISKRMSQCQEQ